MNRRRHSTTSNDQDSRRVNAAAPRRSSLVARLPIALLAVALAALPAAGPTAQEPALRPASSAPGAAPAAATVVANALLESRNPSVADADATQRRLLGALAALPDGSPLAAPLVDALVELRDEIADPTAFALALRELLAGDIHGLVRDSAESGLFRTLRDLGRYDEARALDPQRDQVTELLAVGPFGDQGDFYLDTAFAPELEFPNRQASMPGRFGPVQAYVVRADPASAFVDLADPRNPIHEGCFYGLHRFALTNPTSGWIEVVSAGSLKLWLNGDELTRIDRLTERQPQRLFVPAAFAAGDNELLVKTGLAARSSVALRYVDARGEPLEGLRMLPPEPPSGSPGDRPDPAAAPVPGRFLVPLDLLVRAARNAGEPAGASATAAALVAVGNGAIDLAADLLHAAEPALDGASEPPVLLGWARVYEGVSDLPAELRAARVRALVERACAADARHFSAVSWRARLLQQDDQLEDAVRLLDALEVTGPAVFAARIEARSRLGDRAAVRRLLRDATATFPWSRRSVTQELRTQLRFGITPALETSLAAALSIAPGAPELLALEEDIATARGELERALHAFSSRRFPADGGELPRDLLLRADLRLACGDRDRAVEDTMRAAEHPLATAAHQASAGRALLTLGERGAGLAALRRALDREPGDVGLRRELAAALGLPAFPLLDGERLSEGEVDAIVASFEAGAAEQGATSTLVLDRMVTRMLPDGAWFQEVHQLRRINDREGVEAHEQQTAAARADELVRLRTLGADGNSYIPQRVAGNFAMPRVEPGAFIEAIYREYHDAPGADPLAGPTFFLQGEDEPFLRTELLQFVPPQARGDLRQRGVDDGLEVTRLDSPPTDVAGDLSGHRLISIRRDDVKRPRVERNAPPFAERAPAVAWGEDPAADASRRSDRLALAFRTRVSPWIAAATAEVIQGIESPALRAERIHAFVHELIASEQGPAEPTPTLLRRQGPRFFLEAAMLRAAEVPVRAFACEASNAELDTSVASLFATADPHPLLALHVTPADGPARWLFTDLPRHAPLGFVPAGRDGARALDLETGAIRRIVGDANAAAGIEVRASGGLATGGDLTLDARVTLRDANGLQLAQQIRELPDNRRSLVARNFGGQLLRGFALRGARIDPPPPGEAFVLDAGLLRSGAAQTSGDQLRLALPMPPSQMVARFGDRGERTLPLVLKSRVSELWRLEITLDADLHLVELPPRERVRFEGLDYRLDWIVEGGRLVIERELTLRPLQLPPQRFGEWLRVLARIDAAEARGAALRARGD